MTASLVQRDEQEVRDAVAAIVDAFGDGRLDDYFDRFHPECSFVFHTIDRLLRSVAEYRALWARWVAEDDFSVLPCQTRDTYIQVWGDTAVVTHGVETHVRTRSSEDLLFEQETIVLARQSDARWLAVHEHLSPYEIDR